MATGVVTWSQTAASNATADGNVNWAEGMAPSQVNDSARAMMASVAKWYADNHQAIFTSGGPTYTASSNQGFASLAALNGHTLRVCFVNPYTSGTATLNIDGLGAKAIWVDYATPISPGFMAAADFLDLLYDNTKPAFIVQNVGTPNVLPPGIVNAFAGSSAPTGWLLCDGTGYSQTTYAALFNAISTTYGSTGAGMFSVPDLRARVAVGRDPSNGTSRMSGSFSGTINSGAANLGGTGGEEVHGLTTAELPTFTPSGTIGGSQTFSNVLTSSGGQNVGSASAPAVNVPGSITVNGSNFSFTGNSIGSGASHNTVQPSIVLNYIIKT